MLHKNNWSYPEKNLIGTDFIDINVNGMFDCFSNWNWYRATGKALREVYSDGTIVINVQYANTNNYEDIKYNMNNNGWNEQVDVVTSIY